MRISRNNQYIACGYFPEFLVLMILILILCGIKLKIKFIYNFINFLYNQNFQFYLFISFFWSNSSTHSIQFCFVDHLFWWIINIFFRSNSGIVNIYDMSQIHCNQAPRPVRTFNQLTTSIKHLTFNNDSQILAFSSNIKVCYFSKAAIILWQMKK